MYARVMDEDKVLCENAQRNLESGVFGAGWLHPKYEKAPIFFQEGVREVVRGHGELEGRVGRVVQPAVREGLRFGGEGESEWEGEEKRVVDSGGDRGVEVREEVLAC